ncbi:uncharacterized protein [Lolium perenne]|uniref:uncharacterized protein n=1 Tax=Lolium perenne TaxID=4522 RepID=UPI0021F5D875|nr:uncharacterized protein LOC127332885 [Lolium perenne]
MATRKELDALERTFQENSLDPEEDEDDEKMRCVLPLFYDSKEEVCAEIAATAAAAAERRRREAEEKAREAEEEKRRAEERKRLKEEAVWRRKKHEEVVNSIRQYNTKTKRVEYIRFPFADFSKFNLNEISPILAMRNTGKQIHDRAYFNSINVLSVKIVSSDKGFPLNVYGNIILRDNLDKKCIYLFYRPTRRDSELINSEDQSLILTGPSRGLVLTDYIYIEVDLKMKLGQGKDKQLSIGLLDIDGRVAPRVPTTEVQCCTLESSLSTVEVRYALVKEATEATVEFQVLKGDFKGKITAHTTRIHDRMLLHDSRACGAVTSSDGSRVIELLRRVLAVCVDEVLFISAEPEGVDTLVKKFTPSLSGSQSDVFDWGAVKLGVKVTWSVISF